MGQLVPQNMLEARTFDSSVLIAKEQRDWLKLEAPKNICSMLVTLEVSRKASGWLKLEAPSNI